MMSLGAPSPNAVSLAAFGPAGALCILLLHPLAVLAFCTEARSYTHERDHTNRGVRPLIPVQPLPKARARALPRPDHVASCAVLPLASSPCSPARGQRCAGPRLGLTPLRASAVEACRGTWWFHRVAVTDRAPHLADPMEPTASPRCARASCASAAGRRRCGSSKG